MAEELKCRALKFEVNEQIIEVMYLVRKAISVSFLLIALAFRPGYNSKTQTGFSQNKAHVSVFWLKPKLKFIA